jgi:putative hydrolase of the HAD superfamily
MLLVREPATIMASVETLFWDNGGVILSNGWDRAARMEAVEKFHLDWDDFEDRHELMLNAFETGQASLDQYLQRTVFYRARPFTMEEFKSFMFTQSKPYPESLKFLGTLARTKRYILAALNNESREINEYRIKEFRLRDYFEAFFSSCYLGVRKPDAQIYRLALSITQREPAECVMIDDRGLNLECARELGMQTIQFQNVGQLKEDLGRLGITTNGA